MYAIDRLLMLRYYMYFTCAIAYEFIQFHNNEVVKHEEVQIGNS